MKERRDFIEVEAKCVEFGGENTILDCIREVASEDHVLHQCRPRCPIDVYFDNSYLDLCNLVAPFRLRRRSTKDGWTANFKLTATQPIDGVFLERREIVTVLAPQDAVAYMKDRIPGVAASTAYRLLESEGCDCEILPVIVMVSWRRHYTLSLRLSDDRFARLIHVMIDNVTARDVRELDTNTLIATDKLDIPVSAANCLKFNEVCEIEIDGRGGFRDRSFEFAKKLIWRIEKSGARFIMIDKYTSSAQRLRMLSATTPDCRK